MNEGQLMRPKRWVATPVLCWLVILNLIFVVGPYLAPDKGTTILIAGRFPLAGMVGVWIAMGTGRTPRRVSVIAGAVVILAVLDSQLVPEVLLMFVAAYLVTITGGAMVGMIGNILRRRESDPLERRPQFSIAEIAGWTAFIAAVLGLTVFLREREFAIDIVFTLMLLGFHGAFVGLICLPLYAAPGKSRGRWIGGAIFSAVPFLFLECVVYYAYEGRTPGDPHMVQEIIFFVALTKIPAIVVTLAMVIPLGSFPLWRDVDDFESPELPPEV